MPPPPLSKLFPYTTLFRSERLHELLLAARAYPDDPATLALASRALRGFGSRADVRRLDRKSTRLNSSHRTISYAVFCLKKKKKKQLLATYHTPSNTPTSAR